MEAGTSIQSPLVSLASSEVQTVATVTSLKGDDLPDLSILTKATGETSITQYPTTNGTLPTCWGPVTPPMDGGESLSMDPVDESATLRAQIRSLRDELNKLRQSNKRLEREKQDAISSVEAHEISKTELMEKKQKLERENDDYLRTIVSANKKVDFFEKNLREMRLKCQEYEEILRHHGLLPGADVSPLPNDAGADALLVTARKHRNQLEQLITAQYIKLDALVQKSSRHGPRGSQLPPATGTKLLPMPKEATTAAAATASQGARQKTRPSTLLETSEETWPSLTPKVGAMDPSGTKQWCDAQQRTRWMPEDDRSLNPCDRQFKEMRLDDWIRALPRPEFPETTGEDKDYVIVPTSVDLPTGNPNSGCHKFSRLRVLPGSSNPQSSILPDLRGSIAPVHEPCYPMKHGEVSEDNRRCPVCDMEFSDVITLLEYESHVADCCEHATSARDLSSPPLNSPVMSPLDRKCPVCSGDFSNFAQKEFESHVVSHFEEDQEMDGATAPSTPDVLEFHA